MKKNKVFNEYNLSDDDIRKLYDDIKVYFLDERDENIGLLASESILEFFLNTLGKHIYNKALDDVKLWYDKKADDMESDFYSIYKYLD